LSDPQHAEAIDNYIDSLNRDIDSLDTFLNQQHYRLAFWRTADQELGYRRFFNVNTLVGLRVEREHVFGETHTLILAWLKQGVLDGLRIDHPDGLRDPLQYFQRLRQASSDSWIIAEKILARGETLRAQWPIHGTTGYEFMNQVMGLFINEAGLRDLTDGYVRFSGEPVSFDNITRDKKLLVMQESLGSDVNRLVSIFVEICEAHRDRRDYTRAELRRAIREIAASMPVYRTYVAADSREVAPEDQLYLYQAIEKAKLHRTDISADLFDFIGDVLTLKVTGTSESEFVMRFQQFTSPVMAKGVEDMAFYCFNRFVAANEVGGNPAAPAVSIADFHDSNRNRLESHPHAMLSLSTHDTKRSEDVRARLCTITEIPSRWHSALRRWARMNLSLKTGGFPDTNAEYLYYQTVIGAWPISADRLSAYMQKAAREARQHTSWSCPHEAYESALNAFVRRTLEHRAFTEDVDRFVSRIKDAGYINSLSQVVLKNTCPGVPDLYQGSEIWDFSLVDPDNRRPVDYELRKRLLGSLDSLSTEDILARAEEGLPKLLATHRSLQLRRNRPLSFGPEAAYKPLSAKGPRSEHIVAFQRGVDVLVVVPRLVLTAGGHWAGTSLDIPPGVWRHEFTSEIVPPGPIGIQQLFRRFPVALLTSETDSYAHLLCLGTAGTRTSSRR
jgi:(1->4)-alpha-D-glucan 1-alpha-D-glucosylmutase